MFSFFRTTGFFFRTFQTAEFSKLIGQKDSDTFLEQKKYRDILIW